MTCQLECNKKATTLASCLVGRNSQSLNLVFICLFFLITQLQELLIIKERKSNDSAHNNLLSADNQAKGRQERRGEKRRIM